MKDLTSFIFSTLLWLIIILLIIFCWLFYNHINKSKINEKKINYIYNVMSDDEATEIINK